MCKKEIILTVLLLGSCVRACLAFPAAGNQLITNGSPVRVLVPVDDSLGTNWITLAFDDTAWLPGSGGVGYETNAVGYTGEILADSSGDWSNGIMGQYYWLYGYYNRTADPDGIYDPLADFNFLDANWTYLANVWQLGVPGNPGANPPWTRVGREDVHPNGINNGAEHWAMRRWISTYDGAVTIEFHLRKANAGAAGITGKILHNGVELFSQAMAGNDQVGFNVRVTTTLAKGDTLDFAQTPIGLNGNTADGSDSGVMTARILAGTISGTDPVLRGDIGLDIQAEMRGVNPGIYTRFLFTVDDPMAIDQLSLNLKWNDGYIAYLNGKEVSKANQTTVLSGTTVANSITDWSTDPFTTSNGWTYGFYNRTQDGDGVYQAADLTAFPLAAGAHSVSNYWTGSIYDWFQGNPPWTQLGRENCHPNGSNNGDEHWVVRRWTATVSSNLSVRVQARKQNTNGGDGIDVRVFHNDVQVFSQSVAGTDGVGFSEMVDLPGLIIGDTVDIALLPRAHDGVDGSFFSAEIFQGVFGTPWNAPANGARTVQESFAATRIDLTTHIGDLLAGTNMLAIHGMNVTSNDDNFLIAPVLVANQLPSQGPDTLIVTAPDSGSVPVADVLATDSDPNGDPLLILGVEAASVLGGTVEWDSGALVYTPPAGVSGPDSFVYIFSDGSGIPVSGTVNVTIIVDSASPHVVGATALQDLSRIALSFSEPMDPVSAGDPLHYAVDNEFIVSGVELSADARIAILSLDRAMSSPTTNCVTVSSVEDASGNVLDPNPSTACVPVNLSPCFARADFWLNVGGSALASLTGLATYPDLPDEERYRPLMEIVPNQANNFGARLAGWLRAPLSGDYHFAMSSDDNGSFSLATNSGSSALVQLCSEPVWNNPRDWTGTARRNAAAPENQSATLFPSGIALVAGEYYYFEALVKEGGGGDNLGVTWQIPGEPAISVSSLPISGQYLYTLDEPRGSQLSITQQPQDVTVVLAASDVAGFSVVASGVFTNSDATAVLSYRWQRNNGGGWSNVYGAAASSYSFSAVEGDDGIRFRCIVCWPNREQISDEAALAVFGDLIISSTAEQVGDSLNWTIPAAAGVLYRLERTLSLEAPIVWELIDGPRAAGISGPLSLTDPAPPDVGAYYRVGSP